MRWQATLDESIVIDDKGLRSLLKKKNDPGAFAEALCLRFEKEIKRQLDAGIPLMVEFKPSHDEHLTDPKSKKLYGMTGGM